LIYRFPAQRGGGGGGGGPAGPSYNEMGGQGLGGGKKNATKGKGGDRRGGRVIGRWSRAQK